MNVQIIAKRGNSITGTSRYTDDLYSGLMQIPGINVWKTPPHLAPKVFTDVGRRFNVDAGAFFSSYPFSVALEAADVYHISTQTMATLLLTRKFPAPVVVTVLDIIPWLLRHDPELNTLRHPLDAALYRLALTGLRRADAIIAISEYTKRTLIETLALPEEKIHVVYPGVDLTHFRPMPVPVTFYERYGMTQDWYYVLYVGSEDPRKNVGTLVKAIAEVKKHIADVRLLKVGRAHFASERQKLHEMIAELGISDNVVFFDDVPDKDLPLFYNAVDLVVMPSLYEGFGYPVVEAMACGTPVIAANVASLPEILGNAGLCFDPYDIKQLSTGIINFFGDEAMQQFLVHKALERSRQLGLATCVNNTLAMYQRVLK